VVHFSAALLVSAVFVAPWHSMLGPAIVIGLAGAVGLTYILRVVLRAKRLTAYVPDAEDWACYTILPLLGYLAIFAGAVALAAFPWQAPFAVAAGIVLLLFIGIHNAWDIVTYLALGNREDPPDANAPGP
jgi:hypothetical protein